MISEATMNTETFPSIAAIVLAFGTGLAVGVVFSLVKLPSPAPPLLGLIGLVGMFVGQRLWPGLQHIIFKGH
jgi:XapX domain-containing protein